MLQFAIRMRQIDLEMETISNGNLSRATKCSKLELSPSGFPFLPHELDVVNLLSIEYVSPGGASLMAREPGLVCLKSGPGKCSPVHREKQDKRTR